MEKELAKLKDTGPYDVMNEYAKDIPAGSYGMMCAFSDAMNFINWEHASPTFTSSELDPVHLSKYAFYRATLENTAMITKGHLDLMRETTRNQLEEIISAGDALKSPLRCQILPGVLGLPVKVPVVKEVTTLGVAILVSYGTGIYKNMSKATKKPVQWDITYVPDSANYQLYCEIYEQWRRICKAQLNLCNQDLTRST